MRSLNIIEIQYDKPLADVGRLFIFAEIAVIVSSIRVLVSPRLISLILLDDGNCANHSSLWGNPSTLWQPCLFLLSKIASGRALFWNSLSRIEACHITQTNEISGVYMQSIWDMMDGASRHRHTELQSKPKLMMDERQRSLSLSLITALIGVSWNVHGILYDDNNKPAVQYSN